MILSPLSLGHPLKVPAKGTRKAWGAEREKNLDLLRSKELLAGTELVG